MTISLSFAIICKNGCQIPTLVTSINEQQHHCNAFWMGKADLQGFHQALHMYGTYPMTFKFSQVVSVVVVYNNSVLTVKKISYFPMGLCTYAAACMKKPSCSIKYGRGTEEQREPEMQCSPIMAWDPHMVFGPSYLQLKMLWRSQHYKTLGNRAELINLTIHIRFIAEPGDFGGNIQKSCVYGSFPLSPDSRWQGKEGSAMLGFKIPYPLFQWEISRQLRVWERLIDLSPLK